ncbi:hypothetical protein ACHAXA_009566 [Cyclostephanos tholiformis]|uniref:Protein kinase domain-containing protein n=1 Tax=Cyclostephanos tholiformis TaxID=382380 RepID=A0ABD3SDR0_9STRA
MAGEYSINVNFGSGGESSTVDDFIDVDNATANSRDVADHHDVDVSVVPDSFETGLDGGRKMQFAFGTPRGNRREIIRRSASRRSSGGESFAESLRGSFSGGSFTSDSGPPSLDTGVCGGNLIFATDAEVATLMYGDSYDDDDDDNANCGTIEGASDELNRETVAAFSTRRCTDVSESSGSFPSPSAVPMNLKSSLPPSATLGTGSFSTVRLAWRKRAPDDASREDVVNATHSAPCQDGRRRRRSIVRVHNKIEDVADDDANCDDSPERSKGELVAVKIIQKSILKQMKTMHRGSDNRLTVHTAFDDIEREIATMKRLRHPNLVRLYEVIDSIESDCLLMVLEYVSLGEILSHVQGTNRYTRMRYRKKVKGLTPEGHFDERHAALYFVDIMHGLAYLHRNRICHRDLKPENILLCASGVAKISDFGVSHIFEDEKSRQSFKLTPFDDDSTDDVTCENDNIDQIDDYNGSTTHLLRRESDQAMNMTSQHNSGILKKTEGTWCFWSPEMCSATSDGFSAYSADLWAAGVCLYIFTTGKLPFFSIVPSDLFDMISKANVPYVGLRLSDSLRDLLGKLLEKDPSARAGVGDCLRHEFCVQARTERIDELGYKLKRSEQEIILSKNDVDMALSITRPPALLPMSNPSAPPRRYSTSATFDDSLSDNDNDTERGCAERIDEDGCSQTDETSEVNDTHRQQSYKRFNSIVLGQYSTLKKWCWDKLGSEK